MSMDKRKVQRVYHKHLKTTKDSVEAHNRTLEELGGKYDGTDASGERRRAVGAFLRPRKIGKPARKASEGSVSWGTMREQDLIPKFMRVLEHCHPVKAKNLRKQYRAVFRWLDAGAPDFSYNTKAGQKFQESLSYLVNESLFNALNECAPAGCYFGSNEGDGSDYGFWRNSGEDF